MTTLISVIFLIPFKYLNLKQFNFIIPASLVILSILLNYNYFRPHDYLGRTDNYYIDRYIPVPTPSTDYLNSQEEYLRLPRGTEIRPDKIYPLIFSDKNISFSVVSSNGIYSQINIDLINETQISYSKYYFPGWTAKIDGKTTNINVGKPFGQVSITVPKGEHTLEFIFGETLFNKILDIISVLTLLAVLILSFKKTNK